MTDPTRFWILAEVQALTPEQVRALSHDDFVAAMRAAQHGGAGATRFDSREVTLPGGARRSTRHAGG